MRAARHIVLLGLLTLAACVEPTTVQPVYSQAELQKEQRAQSDAAKAAHPEFDANKKYSVDELNTLKARLNPIASRIATAARSLCADMRGPQAKCDYQVLLDANQKGLNAYADGKDVVVHPAMIEFATNDTPLAFVIAHEFAHNIMGHIEAQKKNVGIGGILGTVADIAASSQGYNTSGAFGKFGANQALLKYSPNFEREADYVGLYILARGGYPIEDAPNFWRMMSVAEPGSIYVTTTHPNNPSRTIEMEKTVAEIRQKQQNNQPLLPNIRPKA